MQTVSVKSLESKGAPDASRRDPNGWASSEGKTDSGQAADTESRELWNASRYVPGSDDGHYESWFQRANHPTRALAFWIRYTIFAPKGRPDAAEGELWAVFFDGESGSVSAVKRELPFAECRFARTGLQARIGQATLDAASLDGGIESGGQRLRWALRYTSPAPTLLTFARRLYGTPIPKAKTLIGSPNAVYSGTLEVGDAVIDVDGWVGSQNHNWGPQHTDRYAWGQVSEFDGEPGSFLEVATAYLKLGPVTTPPMTMMVLRLDGQEHRLSSIRQSLRADGRYDYFNWSFSSSTKDVAISGTLSASADAFVGLPYRNPPGGTKTCLNSKIARCDLTVRLTGAAPRSLSSRNRAAFEILTDDHDHGTPVMPVGADGLGGIGRGRFAAG